MEDEVALSEAVDPELLALASVFIAGHQAEIYRKAALLEGLNDAGYRELLARQDPGLAQYYEARTQNS